VSDIDIDFNFGYATTGRFGTTPPFGKIQDAVHEAVRDALLAQGLHIRDFTCTVSVS
jgi:hypothetical protein